MRITKWSKCYIIEVKDNDTWRVISREAHTQLQAVRLVVQTQFVRRYLDKNSVRIRQLFQNELSTLFNRCSND